MNSSPDRWTEVPMPGDAMLILRGLALAWAMNSATVMAGTDRLTSMTLGERTRPATGAMSLRKLYGSDSYRVALMALEVGTSRNMYPSGAALIPDWGAILPPAPPRFSMTTCWPRRSDSHWAMIRATTSVAPPGGNGTIQCTGRVG